MRVASIETTYVAQTKRTLWRVVVGGEVQHTGHVVADPFGLHAYAEANAWVVANGFEPGDWRHATDRTGAHDSSPPATRRELAMPAIPAVPRASSPEAWIETTYHHDSQQTTWRVIVDREVVAKGVVTGDVTGAHAQEAAERYLAALSLVPTRWSHTSDRTQAPDEPVLGIVRCASGAGALWVALTDDQRAALDARVLICPVCGECCAPPFEKSDAVNDIVFAWNGSRWIGVDRA